MCGSDCSLYVYGFGCVRAVDEKCLREEDELDAELEEKRRLEEEAKDEADYLRLRGH